MPETRFRPAGILDPAGFDAILFDMNGTFMFGHDRLGADEDFHATYRALGGASLDPAEIRRAVNAVVDDLTRKYYGDGWRDRFPSVPDTLRALTATRHLPPSEIDLIADVIACHELGDVDADHVAALERIASAHPVGIVSNIWAPKQRWLDRFEERGLLGLFSTIVFSSDGPHIKPSPALFQKACTALNVAPGRILFVGDDPVYDVAGASAVGMRTVLVGKADPRGAKPDWHVPDLPHLAQWFG